MKQAQSDEAPIDCQPGLPALPPRFWAKVRKTSGCWEWTGGLSDGYGLFWWKGSTVAAHRLLLTSIGGPIRDGLEVDHMCSNRACVRPDHLRLVDHRTNVLAGRNFSAVNAAKVCCPKGHPYDVVPSGKRTQRRCRQCYRDKANAKNRAKRQAKWAARWQHLSLLE
jgi:hypothetical protein